ncbi:MAG: hypothetical protein ACOCYU_07165 [Brevefilum sp.]
MKIKYRCKHCHRLFIPNPRVKDQQYCSGKDCQRARKRHWQRQKMKTDPDYRQNQKESQKKWQQTNPDYWRNYRKSHPEYCANNQQRQKGRDKRNRAKHLAKMDTLKSLNEIKASSYYLIPVSDDLAKMDALMQEIYIIPSSCTHSPQSCKKGLDGHRPEALIR